MPEFSRSEVNPENIEEVQENEEEQKSSANQPASQVLGKRGMAAFTEGTVETEQSPETVETIEVENEIEDATEVIDLTSESYEEAVRRLTRELGSEAAAREALQEEAKEISDLEGEMKSMSESLVSGEGDIEHGNVEQMADLIKQNVLEYLSKRDTEEKVNTDYESFLALADSNLGMAEIGIDRTALLVAYASALNPDTKDMQGLVAHAEGLVGRLNPYLESRNSGGEEDEELEGILEFIGYEETEEEEPEVEETVEENQEVEETLEPEEEKEEEDRQAEIQHQKEEAQAEEFEKKLEQTGTVIE